MKILGINTAGTHIELALYEDEKKIIDLSFFALNNYLSAFVPTIDKFLKINDTKIKDIDLVAVNVGPGSYTGIRIGIASAKGLEEGNNCKLIGVSCLESVAFQYCNLMQDRTISILTSTKYSSYFNGIYRMNTNSNFDIIDAIQENERDELISIYSNNNIDCSINFDDEYKDFITVEKQILIGEKNIASSIASYANYLAKNNTIDNYSEISPFYLQKLQFKPKKDKILQI